VHLIHDHACLCVQVPLSLVYRLDTFKQNGLNPALLMAYGAYGTKFDPEFDSRLLSLLDRGWVVGIAHVRGGGELGYGWHEQGRLAQKPNSFKDLIACAETLISQGITSSSRLAVWGRSAGGLTVGAALNKAPQLFRAAVLEVPFLDVLADLVDASLPLTVKEWEEWGDPLHNATMAELIKSYSPVDNVSRQPYPHMLISAGLNDRRVNYWEPAKWVARLRATQTGDNLLLLKTDMTGGHFSGSAPLGSLEAKALQYAFLIATLPSCGSSGGLIAALDEPQALQHGEGVAPREADSSWGGWAVAVEVMKAAWQGVSPGLLLLVAGVGVVMATWYGSISSSSSNNSSDGGSSNRHWLLGGTGASCCGGASLSSSCGNCCSGSTSSGTSGSSTGGSNGSVAVDLATVAQLDAGALVASPMGKVLHQSDSPKCAYEMEDGIALLTCSPGHASPPKPPLYPSGGQRHVGGRLLNFCGTKVPTRGPLGSKLERRISQSGS
jgi:hypothetical protein